MESSECYICRKSFFARGCCVTSSTKYSKKLIHEIIESISGFPMFKMTSSVCLNCKEMIESYDEFHSKALEIQEKLCNLMSNLPDAVIKTEVTIKEEKIDDLEENEGIFGDTNVDEGSNEESQSESRIFEQKFTEKNRLKQNSDGLKSSKRDPTRHSDVFKCEICFKNFDIKSKLQAHQSFHSNERNFICQTCNKAYKTKACLRMHMKIHTNFMRVFCDHCDLSFTKKASFIRHYISKHTNRREYLCTHCPKAFSSMPTLRHHLFTHSDFKKEVCSICNSRFHTKAKLKRHMRTHAATKEYSCPLCGKLFTQKYNVNAHIKTVHADMREPKKEFSCNICGFGRFSTLLQLRKHLAHAHEVVNEAAEDVILSI